METASNAHDAAAKNRKRVAAIFLCSRPPAVGKPQSLHAVAHTSLSPVLSGVDGVGPPTVVWANRSEAADRAAACEEPTARPAFTGRPASSGFWRESHGEEWKLGGLPRIARLCLGCVHFCSLYIMVTSYAVKVL